LSLETKLRAAASVDALVGRAVAAAVASAVLALATWAWAACTMERACVIVVADVPFGTATVKLPA